ncbi:MAG: cytochrome c biogenesis protein [Bacteroidales bacterium]|nr:cytochrome c biogenesis protein [Bacteroidales bacterium]
MARNIFSINQSMFKRDWWKYLSGVLLLYAILGGFIIKIPDTMIGETIRNLFFHVGMWFGMFTMLITGFIFSLRYLHKFDENEDIVAVEAVNVGLMFGFLGIFTGMIWANFTWGAPWVKDPKLNGAAVGLFIYLAYIILRGSIDDVHKRANVGAVYNIFAFILWIVFVLILPKLSGESIHPGKESTPILPVHLDPALRFVFYPAMVGWILLGFWIMNIRVRMRKIKLKIDN